MIVKIARYIMQAPRVAIRAVLWLNWPGRIAVALVGAGVFSVTAVELTGQPGFCNSCHIMHPYYDSWTQSSHADVK